MICLESRFTRPMGSFFSLLRAFALEPLLWIFLLGLYLLHLGASGLGSPSETFYLQYAKEILLHLQGQPLFLNHHTLSSEAPLFSWLAAFSMKLFGLNLWAARLPAVLGGMAGIILVYFVSLALFSNRMTAILTSVLLAGTWGYFQAAHLGTPVTLTASLLLGSFWAFHAWFPLSDRQKLFHSEKQTLSLVQGALLGLLFLTVGWLGVFIPLLSYGIYLLLSGNPDRLFGFSWLHLLLGLGIVALPWPLWLFVQSGGDLQVLWQVLSHTPLAAVEGPSLPVVSKLLGLLLALLPASFFLVGLGVDYRMGNRLFFRQENGAGFLLIVLSLGLLVFLGGNTLGRDALGSFVLIPTVLLVGYYLGWVMEAGEQSKSFTLTTDILIVLLVVSSVIVTFFVFQVLPDDYIDGFWQLPGPSVLSKLWLGKEITFPLFPVWKLWLLPGLLILLVGGVFLYFLSLTQRTHQVPIVVMAITLCLLLFIRLVFLPIFQRPLFEDFARQLDKRRAPQDTVLLVYATVPQAVQTLFFLKPLPASPVYVTANIASLTSRQLQPAPGKHLYGLMSETDYYHLPAAKRKQLLVLAHNWIWQLPVPFAKSKKSRHADVTPFQEEILLFEAIPPEELDIEMPTPSLRNSSL